MTAACSIPECDRQRWARGWCQRHYGAWKRHGDPTIRKRPEDLARWVVENYPDEVKAVMT